MGIWEYAYCDTKFEITKVPYGARGVITTKVFCFLFIQRNTEGGGIVTMNWPWLYVREFAAED